MSEPFIGQIMPVGFGFAPRGWAFCEGQLLPIAQNTALFSLLGTTFGGDGRTTFGLPDLRGRGAIAPGTGPGLSSIRWGQKGGAENTTLGVANLPSHTHTLRGNTGSANASAPTGNVPATAEDANRNAMDLYSSTAADANMGSSAITNTGSGTSFTNQSPFLGIHYCIALTGIFPSRN